MSLFLRNGWNRNQNRRREGLSSRTILPNVDLALFFMRYMPVVSAVLALFSFECCIDDKVRTPKCGNVLLSLKLAKMNQIKSFKNATCKITPGDSICNDRKRVVVKHVVATANQAKQKRFKPLCFFKKIPLVCPNIYFVVKDLKNGMAHQNQGGSTQTVVLYKNIKYNCYLISWI